MTLICAAQFLIVADDTIVNVALPSVARDLGFTQTDLTWVSGAYLLCFGGLLLLGGRVVDLFGPRSTFVAGGAAFAAVSLCAGLAPSGLALVIARGAQGLAAAVLSPSALALLLATFPDGGRRNRALSVWSAMFGVAGASGVLLGGAITDLLGWRWIFLLNVPVAATLCVCARRLVPPLTADRADGRFDGVGAVLATLGLLTLVYTVVSTHTYAWSSPRILAGLTGSAGLLAAFGWWEARTPAPLVERDILGRRTLAVALVAIFLGAGAMFAFFFLVGLYMQQVELWSPLRAGVAWLPFSVAMLLVGGVVMGLVRGRQIRVFLFGGGLVCAAGFLLLQRIDPRAGYVATLLPSMLVVAAGMGLVFIPVTIGASMGIGEKHAGLASGLIGTAQQIGGAIGLAATATLASDRTSSLLVGGASHADALVGGFHRAFLAGAGLMVCAAIVGLGFRATRAPRDSVTVV